MLIFSTCIGAFVEIAVVGLTIGQSAVVRLSAVPVILFAGRPYGVYRNWLFRRFVREGSSEFEKTVVDTVANMSFQSTLYAALLAIGGAGISQILGAVVVATVVNFFVGRPYGLFLDYWRRLLRADAA